MNGKQLKNSILQWAIQGKLVPQNPKDEPASKLLERIAAQRIIASGAKQSKKTPASRLPAGRQCIYREGSSWFEESKDTQGLPAGRRDITEEIPFDIPESWEWCRLKDVFEMQAGKNVSAANIFPEPSEDHPYQCFGGNGIRGYVKNFNNDGEFPIVGRQGALCGNVNLAKGKFYATEHAVVVTLLGNLDLYWAYFFLIALNLNQYATATAQPGLAVSKIIETFIPLPPFTEQKRIAKKLEQILPLVDECDQAQNQLDKLNKELPETLKKSILQQAIQGKLVPPACRLAGRTQNLPGFEKGKWYTYVIECEDGSFYKGHTSNLSNRFKEHCAGKGADWTASHKPKQVYYYEVHYGEEEAISREKYLKSGAGREWFQKEVVNSPENWEPAQKLLERIIASRNGCSTNQGVILSEAQSAKSKNPAKKKSKNETSRIYRDTDGLWYEQTGSSEPIDISEEIPFEIPENWVWCRIGLVINLLSGRDLEPSQYNSSQKGVPYMTGASNFTKNALIVNRWTECPITVSHKGDLLITCKGTIGTMVFNDVGDVHIARQIMAISSNWVNLEYVKYFLASYVNELQKSARSMIPGISRDDMLSSLIPLPPLAEQKRIVAKLEQLFKAL